MRINVRDASFYGSKISNNIMKTSEGFLVCKNVRLARTGIQEYHPVLELRLENSVIEKMRNEGKILPNGKIKVYRLPEEVFSKPTLTSIEGKTVTNDHPQEDVIPANHANLGKGHGQNVRPEIKRQGESYILSDLLINDPILISEIETGKKREVSLGYGFEIEPYKDGFKAYNMIINHIAVVERGRAGSKVRINDSLTSNINKGKDLKPMTLKNRKQALDTLLASYAENVSGEEYYQMRRMLDKEDEEHEAKDKDDDDEDTEVKDKKKGKDSQFKQILKLLKLGRDAEEGKENDDDLVPAVEKELKKEGVIDKKAKDAINTRLDRLEQSITSLVSVLDKKSKDGDMDAEDSEDDDEKHAKDEDEDKKDDDNEEKAKDKKRGNDTYVSKDILAKLSPRDQKIIKDSMRVKDSSGNYGKVSKIISGKDSAKNKLRTIHDEFNKNPQALGDEWMKQSPHHVINTGLKVNDSQSSAENRFW